MKIKDAILFALVVIALVIAVHALMKRIELHLQAVIPPSHLNMEQPRPVITGFAGGMIPA